MPSTVASISRNGVCADASDAMTRTIGIRQAILRRSRFGSAVMGDLPVGARLSRLPQHRDFGEFAPLSCVQARSTLGLLTRDCHYGGLPSGPCVGPRWTGASRDMLIQLTRR